MTNPASDNDTLSISDRPQKIDVDLQTDDGKYHNSLPSAPHSVSNDTADERSTVNPECIELGCRKFT